MKILRFIVCFLISLALVFLSGYGNTIDDISESLAITTFFGAVLVLTIIIFLLLEMFLSFKTKIDKLSRRIDELENKNNSDK